MVDVDSIRVFLHLLGVAGWIGGQMVMVGLLPLLRTLGPDAPCLAAARFARMAWPCFGLAIATGIWSLFAINLDDRDTGYLTVLLVKLLLVGLPGSAAATQLHDTQWRSAWSHGCPRCSGRPRGTPRTGAVLVT